MLRKTGNEVDVAAQSPVSAPPKLGNFAEAKRKVNGQQGERRRKQTMQAKLPVALLQNERQIKIIEFGRGEILKECRS